VSGQIGSEQSSLACHMRIYNNPTHFSAKFKGKTSSCITVNTVLKLLCLPIYIHVPQKLHSRGSCNFMSFTKNHQGMLIYLIMDNFYDYFTHTLTHVLLRTQAFTTTSCKCTECCHPALHNSYHAVHPYTNYNTHITLGSLKLHVLNCTYVLQKTRMSKYKSGNLVLYDMQTQRNKTNKCMLPQAISRKGSSLHQEYIKVYRT